MTRVVTLAHYYTAPDIQRMADKVGDSLELSLFARDAEADIIVFAGVRFMAETARILNPEATVILPDAGSTCSLVTQTDVAALKAWRERYPDHVHVSYINSSAEHKALSDWIVTSRNVDDIIAHLYAEGKKVIFSPDRNMGAYLNFQYGYDMPLWTAVCEVHDKFNEAALDEALASVSGESFLIAHPESPLPVLKRADYVGSTSGMLNWIRHRCRHRLWLPLHAHILHDNIVGDMSHRHSRRITWLFGQVLALLWFHTFNRHLAAPLIIQQC